MSTPNASDKALDMDMRSPGRVQLLFKFERIDGRALGRVDGTTIRAFAAMLDTLGLCLEQGQSIERINEACETAIAPFSDEVEAEFHTDQGVH